MDTQKYKRECIMTRRAQGRGGANQEHNDQGIRTE